MSRNQPSSLQRHINKNIPRIVNKALAGHGQTIIIFFSNPNKSYFQTDSPI